jgi:prepilin signal peptidase PulO-like enzyme (type II secretory pathway)
MHPLPPSLRAPARPAAWICGGALLVIVALMFVDGARAYDLRFTGRGLIVCALLFGLIVSESMVVRESDETIITAIEEERHGARRMVLEELLLLAPAIIAGLIGLWIATSDGPLGTGLSQAMREPIRLVDRGPLGHWLPLQGLVTAASGFIMAGLLGWAVRIGFTLAFGREAFGAGDIHMMAAAGTVAGWPVVYLGFFLTCGLALLGWLAAIPFKRTRALPLGPWLALGFLIVVLFYQPIVTSPFVERAALTLEFFLERNSQPRPIGVPP